MPHPIFHISPPPLLLAIGNDGRQDDGLGWAFGQAMEADKRFQGKVAYRYQLQVEDALLISEHPTVIFVDACREELPKGFELVRLRPAADFGVTTHQLLPATVLALARQLYNSQLQAYLLKIMGVEWGLERGLSPTGKHYLDRVLNYTLNK